MNKIKSRVTTSQNHLFEAVNSDDIGDTHEAHELPRLDCKLTTIFDNHNDDNISNISSNDKEEDREEEEVTTVFANTNRSLTDPASLSCLATYRHKVGSFVNNKAVEGVILTMIMINAIMMGLNTYDFISQNQAVDDAFEVTDNIFLILFTIESGLHLFHLGIKFFKDAWVFFDFILIVLSWSFSSGSVKAVRALRILRILPRVECLKVVINSIIAVMPKLGAVGMLLILVMFIFSILMTQLFGDLYERGLTEADYFSDLWLTCLTLLQMMTFDGWDEVAREVMTVYPSSWILFVVYVVLTGIFCFNIIIAVTCDSLLYMENEDGSRDSDHEKDRLKKIQIELMQLRDLIEYKLYPDRVESNISPSRLSWENSILGNVGVDDESKRSLIPGNNAARRTFEKGFREKCGDFVNGKYVQAFIMTLIIVNSLTMAVGTFGFVTDNSSIQNAFDVVDFVFLSIYTVESTLQVIYHGMSIYKDGWATFDLLLVISSWVFSFTSIPVQAARSLRLIRILRLIPKLKALKIIVTALISVIPKLGGIVGILLLIYYIFAIIFTTMYKDYNDFFASLDASFFTLFQMMTMSEWAEVARDLDEHIQGSSILIGCFVIVSGFVFLNLIIALICEAMGSIHKLEEAEEQLSIETETGGEKSVTITVIDRVKYIEETQKIILHLVQHSKMVTHEPQDPISYADSQLTETNLPESYIMNENSNYRPLSRRMNNNASDVFFDASSDISYDASTIQM